MLKVGDRIIFDVTGGDMMECTELQIRLGPAIFAIWVDHNGDGAKIIRITDQTEEYYVLEFDDGCVIGEVSKIYFEDLIDGEKEITLPVDQRSVAMELLMREHSAVCFDDFKEVTNILLSGFPGYEKMSGVDLIEDLTDQGLHPEYIRRTVDLKVGDKVQVVTGVVNDRDLGFDEIFKEAIGKVTEINDDRPTPISVDCEKIGRHDSFWRTELEFLGRKDDDGTNN